MKKSGLIIAIIALVLIAAGGVFFFGRGNNSTQNPSPSGGSQTGSVLINNFAFSSSTITIGVGGTVTWTNQDSAPHTIVSDSGSELNSASFSNGGTFSHTFNSAGTYNYHCGIHPSMKGTVVVE